VIDEREIVRVAVERLAPPEPSYERLVQRRDRKRRNQRITAGVVGIAVFVAAVWIVTSVGSLDRTQTPGASGTTAPAEPTTTAPVVAPPSDFPEVDYVIDLNTGEMTGLPGAIIRWLVAAEPRFALTRYAASSDGSMLAFVGTGEEGSPQIFIAGIDGTGVRQVTHDPTRATTPAWSPDGTLIAYEGYGYRDIQSVYVLDLATGDATRITDGIDAAWEPQFTPDGRSLLYGPGLRTVPLAGGESMPLFEAGAGGGNASMSPDGSLVTFLADCPNGGGPCRYVANADGTDWRRIPGWMATPAGTWSPDSSRLVTVSGNPGGAIWVIDVATGERVQAAARGRMAIWLDDHTLLVGV
jgi:Tol biopolymer transport system component